MKDVSIIVSELLEKGYKPGQSINYKQFLEMYEPYKDEMTERKFAEILGCSYENYYSMRKRGTNIRILKKYKEEIQINRQEQIVRELIEKGYKRGQYIDYSEFLKLYEPYKGEMSETKFIEVLDVSNSNYRNMKKKNTKIRILRNLSMVSEKRKNQIIEEILQKGYEPGQLINYDEFLKLYEPYKIETSETIFAEAIGISYASYSKMKNVGGRTRIFSYSLRIDEERKRQIQEENLKKGQRSVDYDTFLKLYEPYKSEMSEIEFAKILDISYINYMSMRSGRSRARVLNSQENREKRQIGIRQQILEKDYYVGQRIDYQEFLRIYKPYEYEISEKDFAKILGISNANFRRMQLAGTRARIFNSKDEDISPERREQIKQEIMARGYKVGQRLNYQEFTALYDLYKKEMTEKDLADILGISYFNLKNIRTKNTRGRIFINDKSIAEKMRHKIVIELLAQGYRIGQRISYEEFLNMYEPYKSALTEEMFAEIIEIERETYRYMRKSKGTTKILKDTNKNLKGKIPEETEQGETPILLDGKDIIADIKICIEQNVNKKYVLQLLMKKYNMSMEEVVKAVEREYGKQRSNNTLPRKEEYLGEEL